MLIHEEVGSASAYKPKLSQELKPSPSQVKVSKLGLLLQE